MTRELGLPVASGTLAPPREKQIDPLTGIYRIQDWGGHCGRGFVSNSRFASSATEQVIPRTNRSAQRKHK